jgi:hypothetical protein
MVVCQLFPAAMRAALGLGMTARRFPPPWSVERSQAFSEFKKQIDYLVWAILFVIGCVLVYSVASLIHSMWR